jgi:hypothetical protein
MSHYNFKLDLARATETEKEAADMLLDRWPTATNVTMHDKLHHDLVVEFSDGKPRTIEVKEDFRCKTSGNVALEFEYRGKPSGIRASKADMFLYKIHLTEGGFKWYLIDTKELRKAVADKQYFRIVKAGDAAKAKVYLFRLPVFQTICEELS